MATAAWGQRVLEAKLASLPPGSMATVDTVLDALHELTPGSTQRAADVAASCYKAASSDVARANCIALMAAAFVLDPTVEGYKERVTDAWGLAQYAGTLDASDSIGQSARALVAAGAGSVEQSKRLVEVVTGTPKLGPEPRLFLALARRTAGDRGDALIEDLQATLRTRPSSQRARALLAEVWLDIGLYEDAVRVATLDDKSKPATADASSPWLDAVKGRALVLDGKLDEGIALLKASEPKLDEGQRGDALYWLGRSLTSKADATTAEIESIAATLAARPGFAKEGAVLNALLAQKAGDYKKARTLLEPVVRGPASLPVDVDAAWLLTDACAGLGDLKCVDVVGQRALRIDGDEARYHTGRAAAVLVGGAPAGDGAGTKDGAPTNATADDKRAAAAQSALREAHRASPFDPALAKKVGEPVVVVEGLSPAQAANRVKAARRALLRKAPKVVDRALGATAKSAQCRICRAIDAQAAAGVDQATKAAKAITGAGPKLAEADLVRTINALGAAPVPDARKALESLDDDKRGEVVKAVDQARRDHADPDARRRRDAGDDKGPGARPGQLPDPHPGHAPHGPKGAGAP